MALKLKQRFQSVVAGIAMGFMVVSAAFGDATLLPDAVQRYVDDTGAPVATGQVFYYIPSTTTKKTIWQDAAKTTPQANPVQLDAGGKPQPAGQTYGDGCYQQVVKDQNNLQIWSAVTCSTGSGSSGTSPAFSEGVMVGTIIPWANTTLPSKYLYTNGQGIARASYPDLFTALTYRANILCTIGIATISVSTTISDSIPIGAPVEASCFAPGTTVIAKSSGLLTLSTNATTTTSVSMTLFPWGNGDGATTFNVPETRGRILAGRNNMGGTPAATLTSAFYGANPNAIAAQGGSQLHTLAVNELPTGITSSGLNAINVSPTGGGSGIPLTSTPGNISTVAANLTGGTASVPASSSGSWGGTSLFTGNNTINVTSTNTSGASHSIVQPTVTSDFIIKALPDDLPTGPGVTSIQGMTGVLTCGTSVVCTGQTISVSIANNSISNSQLAQMGAASFKANPTSGTANAQDITLQSLTTLASPNATLDYMPIYDHLDGTIKKVSVSNVGVASGVSSINGVAGAITGVDTNTLATIGSNYTVLAADCGKTLQFSGTSYLITLPSVAGFDPKCVVNVDNADATRGQRLSGFPADLYPVLYPTQWLTMKIVNGVWTTAVNPGRWRKVNVQFFVDTGGSNTNDGLAAGAGGAFATLNQCRIAAQVSIDTISQGNGGVTCLVTAGQSFQEFVQVFFPLVGGGSLFFTGNGGQFNWAPANSGYALQFGDYGVAILTNVNFTTNGTTTPSGFIIGHQYGVLDLFANVSFTANSPAIQTAFSCDQDTHFNINNGLTYVGTFSAFFISACMNSVWNLNNAINTTGATSIGRWYNVQSSAKMLINGNVTFGTAGLSTSVGLVSGNSVLVNSGVTPPGGAPTPTTGGQYCSAC